ncbi:hypothetical protein ARMSODRAFT_1026334 [Armillaria solidipes]|uniref:NAD(P)-binding protein n=1 Tax=Armillaria solidipes TaxID=1076256 RepID=A0A2H3AVJ7_9AGAR|nr:hypothetical protein ARMSODRAFT_1026334 [Armillaria solidipes]
MVLVLVRQPHTCLFAKEGYVITLIARGTDSLKALSDDITAVGGTGAPFPISSYSVEGINSVFSKIHACYQDHPVRFAVYNAAHGVWKPFLDVTFDDIQVVMQTNIEEAFTFSKNVILAFQKNGLDEKGKRGALILMGATPSIRGSATTSVFSAGTMRLDHCHRVW